MAKSLVFLCLVLLSFSAAVRADPTLLDTGEGLVNEAADAAGDAKNATENAANTATSTAQDAHDAAENAANTAANAVNQTQSATNEAKQNAEDVANTTETAGKNVHDALSSGGSGLGMGLAGLLVGAGGWFALMGSV
ncbi:unnamed protein product [Linum trigynum]|uniref:Uncharacterized protein n=1 Tax=Linum trigynum TaxID=586398 RepID=A0AAV2DR22_9ROSI